MNNFVLYSSFSLTLTVRGVSNKHCLLTFFIYCCLFPLCVGQGGLLCPCFVVWCLMSFHLSEEESADCFTLIVLWLTVFCVYSSLFCSM